MLPPGDKALSNHLRHSWIAPELQGMEWGTVEATWAAGSHHVLVTEINGIIKKEYIDNHDPHWAVHPVSLPGYSLKLSESERDPPGVLAKTCFIRDLTPHLSQQAFVLLLGRDFFLSCQLAKDLMAWGAIFLCANCVLCDPAKRKARLVSRRYCAMKTNSPCSGK